MVDCISRELMGIENANDGENCIQDARKLPLGHTGGDIDSIGPYESQSISITKVNHKTSN